MCISLLTCGYIANNYFVLSYLVVEKDSEVFLLLYGDMIGNILVYKQNGIQWTEKQKKKGQINTAC